MRVYVNLSVKSQEYRDAYASTVQEAARKQRFFQENNSRGYSREKINLIVTAHRDIQVRTVYARRLIRFNETPGRLCVACTCEQPEKTYYCPAYGHDICAICCEFDADAPDGLRAVSDDPCMGCGKHQPHRWEWQLDRDRPCAECGVLMLKDRWVIRELSAEDSLSDSDDDYNVGRWLHTHCAGNFCNAGRFTGPDGEDLYPYPEQ